MMRWQTGQDGTDNIWWLYDSHRRVRAAISFVRLTNKFVGTWQWTVFGLPLSESPSWSAFEGTENLLHDAKQRAYSAASSIGPERILIFTSQTSLATVVRSENQRQKFVRLRQESVGLRERVVQLQQEITELQEHFAALHADVRETILKSRTLL